MLYKKIEPRSVLGPGEENFQVFFFSPYMGMATTLLNDAEPIEQFDNRPLTEGPVQNLVKIGQALSEKTRIYTCIAQG